MIITCGECTTRFQLDDAKVPEQGVRVRCSRCRHAFFVKPDVCVDRSDDETDSLQAVADEPAAAAPQADAFHASPQQDSDPALQTDAQRSSEPECDWEFNHEEVFGHEAALAEAREQVDELLDMEAVDAAEAALKEELFGDSDDVEAGLAALLDGADASPELAAEGPGSEPIATELDAVLGATDAQGLELGEAEPGPLVFTPDDASPFAEPEADADSLASFADLSDEELGSLDDWSFDEEGGEAAQAAGAAAGGTQVLGRIAVGPPGSFNAPPRGDTLPAVEAPPPVLARRVARAGSATGWLATLALLGFAIAAGFGAPAAPRVAASASGEELGFEDVAVHWVDNRVGGALAVIVATQRGLSVPGPPRRYAVRLLDARGSVVEEDAGSFATLPGAGALRESAPDRLRAEIEAEALVNARLRADAPGSRRVGAVLAALPAEARYFEIISLPVGGAGGDEVASVEPR